MNCITSAHWGANNCLWRPEFGQTLTPPLFQSKDISQTNIENHAHRANGFFAVDLTGPRPAILKQNRKFAEFAPRLEATEEHFLLEGVTAGTDSRQFHFAQFADPVTAERPAGVLHWHAEEEPHQHVHALTDDATNQWPVLRPAAANVPRPDHHVVLAHSRKDARQIAGRVAEVRVHVQQIIVVLRHGEI